MILEWKKKKGIPYYIQIRDLLKTQIRSGDMKAERLPSVRQVARQLGVNPNTVLRAYYELSKEGIVLGSVGKGTFITTSPNELQRQNRTDLLMKAIEHALEEAMALEFSIEEFASAVKDYTAEKLKMIHNISLAFIECNIEQLTYFTDHLELDSRIHRIPVLLDDLRARNEDTTAIIRDADIIVTSFYHLDEVRETLKYLDKPIIGINLDPEMRTLIEIAKIPQDSTVGIFTTSEKFRMEIKEILEESNIHFDNLLETSSPDPASLRRLVPKCDAVLVSPRQRDKVRGFLKDSASIIELAFLPDKTSRNNLKIALLELKKNRIR